MFVIYKILIRIYIRQLYKTMQYTNVTRETQHKIVTRETHTNTHTTHTRQNASGGRPRPGLDNKLNFKPNLIIIKPN